MVRTRVVMTNRYIFLAMGMWGTAESWKNGGMSILENQGTYLLNPYAIVRAWVVFIQRSERMIIKGGLMSQIWMITVIQTTRNHYQPLLEPHDIFYMSNPQISGKKNMSWRMVVPLEAASWVRSAVPWPKKRMFRPLLKVSL